MILKGCRLIKRLENLAKDLEELSQIQFEKAEECNSTDSWEWGLYEGRSIAYKLASLCIKNIIEEERGCSREVQRL